MGARIVIALVTILISLGFAKAQSTLQYINWGFEWWRCDTATFQVNIGTGLDVYLVGIYGNATISAQGSADPWAGNSRVSLTSLTNPAIVGGQIPVPATVGRNPGGNQGVDMNAYSVSLRQDGITAKALPINVTFPYPIRLPGGILQAVIVSQVYRPDGSFITSGSSVECPDTEFQLTVFWRY
jgi:hypothetical protein